MTWAPQIPLNMTTNPRESDIYTKRLTICKKHYRIHVLPVMLSTKELAICFVALHPRARARSMQIGTSAAAFRNTGCLCPSKYLRLKRLSLLENRRYGSLRCTGQPFQWRAGCPPLWLPTLKSCWGASHWMKRFHGDNCLDGFGPHTGNLTHHIRFFHHLQDADRTMAVPIMLHGDEGRGLRSQAFMVESFQFVISHLGPHTTNTSGQLICIYLEPCDCLVKEYASLCVWNDPVFWKQPKALLYLTHALHVHILTIIRRWENTSWSQHCMGKGNGRSIL